MSFGPALRPPVWLVIGAYASSPLLVIWLTSILFYLAIQRQFDVTWLILSILHLVGVVVALRLGSVSLVPFNHLFVPSAIIITLHTTSVLFLEKKVVKLPDSASFFAQRLRTVYRIWANPRELCLPDDTCAEPDSPISGSPKVRIRFALLQCGHAIALFAISHLIASFTTKTLYGLYLTRWKFGPDKQGLLPSLTKRDLTLRFLMSYQLIWDTYSLLTAAHNFLAAVFVSLLQWDRPDEWPALFGNITEAYSLRKFWGVFWHRLHVTVFEAYLSVVLRVKPPQEIANTALQPTLEKQQLHRQRQWQWLRHGMISREFRALWIFTLSAICHAASNWVLTHRSNVAQEYRFFLSNHVVYWAETVLERRLKVVASAAGRTKFLGQGTRAMTRVVGYIWVASLFFCLAPAWQYSCVYAALP